MDGGICYGFRGFFFMVEVEWSFEYCWLFDWSVIWGEVNWIIVGFCLLI